MDAKTRELKAHLNWDTYKVLKYLPQNIFFMKGGGAKGENLKQPPGQRGAQAGLDLMTLRS